MDKNINDVVKILKEDLNAENIFTRNDHIFRKLEGLPESDEVYSGVMKEEIINDGSINFKIDFSKSQKTGFFFDQTDNRFFIEKIVKDKNVLDAFCNSGGFGLHAAAAGAASVTFVDSSLHEIESAEENFNINGFTVSAGFIKEDVFDFLEGNNSKDNLFDIVIIDPPAFAKNRKSLQTAKKGYERLNKLALINIRDGGFLVSSSCSHHIGKEEFLNIIKTAGLKTGKNLQLIYINNASMDHPVHPAMNETNYLKFAVFKIT
jgi:23S rRNA (cytosine1962-C5)-methyltransferase